MTSPRVSSFALVLLAGCGGGARSVGPAPGKATASPAAAAATAPAASRLGELDFPVTGSPACQEKFTSGMLSLHSFQYDEAHEAFAAARAADPACAMAAWGDAMTYDHPIWKERDVAAGRAALAAVTAEDRLTDKERAFLAAARALYAPDDHAKAGAAWLAAATAMRRDYPDDDEVALQYALALLRSYGYAVKHVREQMEAGAIALEVLARRPRHPGAAHYVIHAFDSREHAILALPAALTYARIAPAAGHAQHMPSHTFAHLGMWREVVPSNERATAAADAWAKAHGQSASSHDWHSYSWLVAAHLELGHHATARTLIDRARAAVVAATDDSAGLRFDYANMTAAYLVHTGRWADADDLLAPVFAPLPAEGTGGKGPVACAEHAPGGGGAVRPPHGLLARLTALAMRAEAAIRRGDSRAAGRDAAERTRLRRQLSAWSVVLPPEMMARLEKLDALILVRARAGQKPTAAARKQVIAAIEALQGSARAMQSAGPVWLPTGHQLVAELLSAGGQHAEALARYQLDLDEHPAHAPALLGAAREAAAAGDAARAREHYAALAALWRDADADLPALAEVQDGARGEPARAAAR